MGMDLGDGDNTTDAMLDGMMQQLVSKELMYEPMKQVADRFPAWLREHEDSLSAEEKKRYDLCSDVLLALFRSLSPCCSRRQQCETFQLLVRVYETEPENTAKLIDHMQRAQEYGQPPPEIIADIAPDLRLDADGLPQMDEACRIM